MIKREHIKQAIDAISARSPDIGRALDDLLGVGRIETVDPSEGRQRHRLPFLFDKEKVRVKKFIFIHEGTAPIERGLLIKYGELLRKREVIEGRRERDFLRAAREVRAGRAPADGGVRDRKRPSTGQRGLGLRRNGGPDRPH